ncbi:MAG: hypothetical protein ABEJ43_10170 [Haloferacaceae archaeon]
MSDVERVVDAGKDVCEDAVAVGDRCVVVADGTSGFGDRSFTDGASDGRWYATRLVAAFADRLDDGADLRAACAGAIRETARALAAQVPDDADRSIRSAVAARDLPNAKVSAARWDDDGLAYLVLGDASVAGVDPAVHASTPGVLDRVDERTARIRSELLDRGVDPATVRDHQLTHIRATRRYCNVPGGYWVARLNPLAAEFATVGERAPDDGPVLLYTDGFDPLVGPLEVFDDPPTMAAFAAAEGVDALRDRLREAEAGAVHVVDDATAVLVRR